MAVKWTKVFFWLYGFGALVIIAIIVAGYIATR